MKNFYFPKGTIKKIKNKPQRGRQHLQDKYTFTLPQRLRKLYTIMPIQSLGDLLNKM